jgi:NADH-quinone oxidoreductase subunit F
MSKNLRSLSKKYGEDNKLFEDIKSLSESDSFAENLDQITEETLFTKSAVHSTRTFYDFLKPEFRDKKVHICDGSACYVTDKQKKLKEALLKHFSEDEIGTVTCIGRCWENASFLYKGYPVSLKSVDDLERALKWYTLQLPLENVKSAVKRFSILNTWNGFARGYSLLNSYFENPETIIDEVRESKIRGRGGAGFPTHIKLETCRNTEADQKYIVCNGDEGDPGAFSDMYIMENLPYKLIFGMIACAIATGATKGLIYVRGEYPYSVKTLNKAVKRLYEKKHLGENLMGSKHTFDLTVVVGEGAYICGEETSLLNSIEGIRADVRTRPPFPAEEGLFGKPTVLSNVETFANIHKILYSGGKTYARMGTEKSKGTKLVCLDSGFVRPGMYEIVMGSVLIDLINKMGGGFSRPTKAIQVGGPLGGIIPVDELYKLTVDFESFEEHGFLLGHAGVVSIPVNVPFIEYMRHLFDFVEKESCGKCYPCRIGAIRGREMLDRAIDKDELIDRAAFEDLIDTLEEGSLCALGGGITLPIRNILEHFAEEVDVFFK